MPRSIFLNLQDYNLRAI